MSRRDLRLVTLGASIGAPLIIAASIWVGGLLGKGLHNRFVG